MASLLLAGLATAAFADFIPFTSPGVAAQHCPAIIGLTFTANNPNIPNSAGAGNITGVKDGKNFTSIEEPAAAPQTAVNPIQGVSFREAENNYGYISGNVTTCLYSYPTIFGGSRALIMRESN